MKTATAERDALYDRLIVERARTPLHAGRLDRPDVQGDGRNPLCGDKTHLDIVLDGTIFRPSGTRHVGALSVLLLPTLWRSRCRGAP